MRDFITPDRFRTVEREQYDYAHGVHEIPVVIDLDKKRRNAKFFRWRAWTDFRICYGVW